MSGHHHSHDDHHGHSHDHGHSGHDHSHDLTPALQSNLYQQIDFSGVTTLNEKTPRSGAAVVQKTWAQRLDPSPELESDADEQLLIHVPFTGSVKLHAILLHTSDSPSAPKTIRLFKNRDDLDFNTATDMTPTQTLDVPRSNDVAELPVNRALWNTTTSITLFVESNHGDDDDVTRLDYLGFRGDFTPLNREPISVLYEAAANPADHALIQGLANVNPSMPGQ